MENLTLESVLEWLQAPLIVWGSTPITALGVVTALLVVLIALVVSRIIQVGLNRISRRLPNLEPSSAYTLGRIIHYVVLVAGVFVTREVMGLDLTRIALIAGALGVGVRFGLQTIVNNLVSGLILLFEKTVKVGDYAELESGISGEVREIRYLHIRSGLSGLPGGH